jgi:hypothetical protein
MMQVHLLSFEGHVYARANGVATRVTALACARAVNTFHGAYAPKDQIARW